MSVMSCGRVFHSRGPATEKALSPKQFLSWGCRTGHSQLLEAYSVQVMLTEDGQCHEFIADIDQSQQRASSDIT